MLWSNETKGPKQDSHIRLMSPMIEREEHNASCALDINVFIGLTYFNRHCIIVALDFKFAS